MINAELRVIGGKHTGQVIRLDRKKYLIGREQDCQLRPNSDLVSRHHCVFSIDDFSVRLRDLGSTNGTSVNGQRILKEVILAEGDHVIVGSLEFEFRIARPKTGDAVKDDTVIAADTVSEMTPIPQSVPATDTDSTIDQPQKSGNDTTVIHQSMLIPGQQPYQPMMPQNPMMPQHAGYPGQMYAGFPYQPQMHMYPQGYMPQMLPGQMPTYPPQPYPPADVPSSSVQTTAFPSVTLPEPSETGAKDAAPKAPAPDGSAAKAKSMDGDSTNAAASIIKQYTQRRPGTR